MSNLTYLVVTNSSTNKVYAYKQPVTSASTVFATWSLGSAPGFGRFDTSENLWIPAGNNQVKEFKPPFTNATKAALTVTRDVAEPIAVAFDSSGNMYVAQTPMGGCCPPFEILRFAPPYTGTPVVNRHVPVPIGVAVHGNTLVVSGDAAEVAHCDCGELDSYTLPLTASSVPVVTPFTHGNPWTPAFDPSGNLYVPWNPDTGAGGVDVFRSPLTASSQPAFTISKGMSFPIQTAIGP